MPFPRLQALCRIALLSLAVWGTSGQAANLGSIEVKSGLGQPLHIDIPIFDDTGKEYESLCLKARIESPDGSITLTPQIALARSAQSASLLLTTRQPVSEPVLNISASIDCNLPVQHEYQVLLDPAPIPPITEDMKQTGPSASEILPVEDATPKAGEKRNRPADSGGMPRARQTKTRPAAVERSVFKMSLADEADTALHLKSSNMLFFSNLDPLPQNPTETEMASAPNEQELLKAAVATIALMQAQMSALREETERIKQNNAMDQAALESVHAETRNWIAGLGTLLVLCIAAIGWLLWRFRVMSRNEPQSTWADVYGDNEMNTIDPTRLGENTEFNTAVFSTTVLNNTVNFNTAVPPPHHAVGLTRSGAIAAAMKKPDEIQKAVQEEAVQQPIEYNPDSSPPYALPGRMDTALTAKAEEISDVMELAEAWMALHHPTKVLEILEPFNKVEQPESPLPWLCLLDVHRVLGDQKKYEAILERIKKIFNVKLAHWDNPTSEEQSRTLADFPHIRNKILDLWENGEALPYLENLVRDNRGGLREGFDLPLYRDILRLITLTRAPDRPKHREQLMHENSYAMLFAPPTQTPAASSGNVRIDKKQDRKNAEAGHTEGKFLSVSPASSPNDMSPMAIKLHLASAYQDIGDKEGASLLLEEVIQDGTPEQSEQAKLMLEKLA